MNEPIQDSKETKKLVLSNETYPTDIKTIVSFKKPTEPNFS